MMIDCDLSGKQKGNKLLTMETATGLYGLIVALLMNSKAALNVTC